MGQHPLHSEADSSVGDEPGPEPGVQKGDAGGAHVLQGKRTAVLSQRKQPRQCYHTPLSSSRVTHAAARSTRPADRQTSTTGL